MKFKLHNYGGIIVETDIDLSNIIALVKYNDHGDDFVIAKTNDGIFKYGWFLNRHFYPDWRELERSPERFVGEGKRFIKAPELYFEYDANCEASNKICFDTDDLEEYGEPRNYWSGYRIKKYEHASSPQHAFDWYCDDVKEVYEGKGRIWGGKYGHTYHCDYNWYGSRIRRFLEKHGISTEENLRKLKELKKYWRVGEVDGSAGIVKSDGCVVCDGVNYIWYRGKELTPKDLKKEGLIEETEWGDFDQIEYSMEQFA